MLAAVQAAVLAAAVAASIAFAMLAQAAAGKLVVANSVVANSVLANFVAVNSVVANFAVANLTVESAVLAAAQAVAADAAVQWAAERQEPRVKSSAKFAALSAEPAWMLPAVGPLAQGCGLPVQRRLPEVLLSSAVAAAAAAGCLLFRAPLRAHAFASLVRLRFDVGQSPVPYNFGTAHEHPCWPVEAGPTQKSISAIPVALPRAQSARCHPHVVDASQLQPFPPFPTMGPSRRPGIEDGVAAQFPRAGPLQALQSASVFPFRRGSPANGPSPSLHSSAFAARA